MYSFFWKEELTKKGNRSCNADERRPDSNMYEQLRSQEHKEDYAVNVGNSA